MQAANHRLQHRINLDHSFCPRSEILGPDPSCSSCPSWLDSSALFFDTSNLPTSQTSSSIHPAPVLPFHFDRITFLMTCSALLQPLIAEIIRNPEPRFSAGKLLVAVFVLIALLFIIRSINARAAKLSRKKHR